MMTRREFYKLLAGMAAYTALPGLPRLQGEERRMLVGVSAETLAGTNVNDARAAYKVWAAEITRSLGMYHTDLIPDVFIPSSKMIAMIRAGTIDCFAITAWEYAKVVDLLDPGWLLVQDYIAAGLEYILVVHHASPFAKLADLRGHQIIFHRNQDTVLLEAWMDLLLAGNNLGAASGFFSGRAIHDNLTQVVLPVFFRRAEAAAMTRRVFDIAVELNPQLGRDLRVLATSPKVIPSAFCFRRGCRAEDKQQFKNDLRKFGSIPAGQQILQLYQVHAFKALQASSMKETLEIVWQHDRLSAHTHAASGQSKAHP